MTHNFVVRNSETRFSVSLGLLSVGLCIALGGCAHDPVDAIVANLRDRNVEVRQAATNSLVEQPVNDSRVIKELTKNSSDKSSELRYKSTQALGKLGSAASSSLPLLRLRLQDLEKNVRLRAAFSIQKIDPADRSFVPVLTDAMREGDGRTLLEVGALGPQAAWAVPTLSQLLTHESPKVRTLAAKALGNIGPAASEAKMALEAARADSNAGVQKAANDALARMQKPAEAAK
jgi:HEAT repeat protein